MKKEPLFFTEKTEIGAQHVPINNTKFDEGGQLFPNTQKLIEELKKNSDYSVSQVMTNKDGEKYQFHHWKLKYKSASNYLVQLFMKASLENTGKNYNTNFAFEDFSFYYDRPPMKNRPNGSMSMRKLEVLESFKDGGSIDNERIVCENCGWSWKVEDGGDDLYECHKCDHDNTPHSTTKFANGGLIAPNGKPSNLTPEQYKLVRTPEFKAWFGDWENDPENASKVVDENGEPMVCYHGTYIRNKKINGIYTELNTSTYFTDQKLTAEKYPIGDYVFYNSMNDLEDDLGDDYTDYINDNFDIDESKGIMFSAEAENVWENFEFENIHIYECFLDIKNPKMYYHFSENEFEFQDLHKDSPIINQFKNEGYDGLIKIYEARWFTKDWVDLNKGKKSDYKKEKHFVIFNPNQIKLADGTNTTFDPTNPDIRFDKGGQVNPNLFMNWYIDWYKGISDKMVITMSLPNAIAPFREKNVVILDVFEKKDQNTDAKPYLKKIVEKADEYGVVIYLEPKPRTDSVIDYYERFGFELTPNKQFMKRIPHFAGGGGIDINEPFNVNGKTLAERVRILLKQLYPDYKWSVTSSYNKLDVYLLEADFDPFTDSWREEYPTRDLYYNVDNRDFESYARENNPLITDRAVEVFKPIREYIDKFVFNRNAGNSYADGVDYNVYENTYIGKWDKPYKQVEPKAGKKKPKTPVTPTVNTPPTKPPFKVGDILAFSQDKLNRFTGLWAKKSSSEFYFEVTESVSPFEKKLIKYDDLNKTDVIVVETNEILDDYVKATKPLFKTGDTVVNKLRPDNPYKIKHRAYYQQIGVKYASLEKRFLLSGMTWNYELENGTYANEGELELYNATPSTAPTPTPNNVFSIQNIVSKTQWSEGLKKTMIEDFVNSGYENVTPLIGKTSNDTSNNIIYQVDGFDNGKNTYLQANTLAEEIHKLIDAGNSPLTPTAPTVENTFIDYLNANNEKANEISKELEVTTSLAMFVMGSKDIANLDSKKYAELMEEFLSKFPKLIEDDSTNAN